MKVCMKKVLFTAISSSLLAVSPSLMAAEGVSRDSILLGGVMDLEGQSRGLGQGMKLGIDAAFANQRVQGKRLDFVVKNDSYTPELTIDATKQLINSNVFAMIGNVGTPTAQVSLPLLADAQIPAVGFFTGAGLLRPGDGQIVNYRASYVQEVAAVISKAIDAGVRPNEICAYVQNDAYGMAGVAGIIEALKAQPRTRTITSKLEQILAMQGNAPERNNIGPVGVYQRNTLTSRDGYQSLKAWETSENTQCRLVVTTGAYSAIGRFAAYAKYKNEDWVISALSFTGAGNLASVLTEFGVSDRVIMTQVVPALDENLAIVQQAQAALGDDLNYVSLEGFIVGKMMLTILNSIQGDITRQAFNDAVRNHRFDLGGLELDFNGDNQASDLVSLTYFANRTYQPMTDEIWQAWF